MHNQSFVVLVDSQVAIKALIKYTVTSIRALNCIRNLNQLGKQNHLSIAWIPGHSGVHGNEVADYLAKLGSKSKIQGCDINNALLYLLILFPKIFFFFSLEDHQCGY